MSLKQTLEINPKAAQTIYYAVGTQANRIGFPLNVTVTINFSQTDIDPKKCVPILQKLIQDKFVKWATRPRKGAGQKYPPTWAYVFENSRDGKPFNTIEDGKPHNVHCHLLVHVPNDRRHEFEQIMWEWLDFYCQKTSADNAILIKNSAPERFARAYVLKGVKKQMANHYGTNHRPQGLIIGRRTGTSRNLGPTARKKLDKALNVNRKQNMLRVA